MKKNTLYLHWIYNALLLLMLISCAACSSTPQQPAKPSVHSPSLGQQIWKQGVSSYLFGTNDTQEWSSDSLLTDPKHTMVPDLAHAHFGLVRSFFFHYTIYTDEHRTTLGQNPASTKDFSLKQYENPAPQAGQLPGDFYEIERRVRTIEQIGATCLGVLPNIITDSSHPSDGVAGHHYVDPVTGKLETDLQFDEEVVAYLGNRCNLYEFGNEPDYNGISESTYVQKWDEFIPLLKTINPKAKFIGPVTADNRGLNGTYMTDFLTDMADGRVKPIPDAISFHDYSCPDVNASNESRCFDPNNPLGYTTVIDQLRGWMQQILGHTLPLGITEWNTDPASNPYMENAAFMIRFTHDAMQAMIDAKLDFAAEFAAQSYSAYCHLDMFDSCWGTDQPKAQFTEMSKIIRQYYSGAAP